MNIKEKPSGDKPLGFLLCLVEARATTTLSRREVNGWRGQESCCIGDGKEVNDGFLRGDKRLRVYAAWGRNREWRVADKRNKRFLRNRLFLY